MLKLGGVENGERRGKFGNLTKMPPKAEVATPSKLANKFDQTTKNSKKCNAREDLHRNIVGVRQWSTLLMIPVRGGLGSLR